MRTDSEWLYWPQFKASKGNLLPPPGLRSWLLEQGSLTARVRSASSEHLQVRALRQLVDRPSSEEARYLNLAFQRLALIRDVEISGVGGVWFTAHSVMPLSSLQGKLRPLRHWPGSRSLGDFLYSNPTMYSGPIQICTGRDAEQVPWWGRRRIYHLYGKPLLVCEFFSLHSPCANN